MIMVADFTSELRLELHLPRSAAKTGGNSLASGTDLITPGTTHSVAVTSLPKYASSGVARSRTSCTTTLVVERETAGRRPVPRIKPRVSTACGIRLRLVTSEAKDQRGRLDVERLAGFNQSAEPFTYRGKNSFRTTRATAFRPSTISCIIKFSAGSKDDRMKRLEPMRKMATSLSRIFSNPSLS
jgi:hypothetical protein